MTYHLAERLRDDVRLIHIPNLRSCFRFWL
jgi:hypothetical protein